MVNTSTSPKIQYGYANGSSNQVRQLSVSYPSGRAIDFDYGSSGGVDERLSRVQKLTDGATALVEYNYLGAVMPVQVRYPQPDVTMDLWGGTAGTYTGLDRFGRLTDLPWIHDLSGSPTDLARIKYGYNRASSPTYARDEVARAANADLDQLYGYDGLQRLIDFQQGELSGTNTSISSSTLAQDWNLDQVGNWDGFNQEVTGILNQTRTHNRVNEITGISNASGQPVWVDPGYDDAGNMILTPRPNDPTNGFALTFDAWNRIAKVETTDASPKLVAQYAYDGRNHRTNKRLYDSSGSLASTIEYFYNSAWQCVEEQETPVSSSTSTSTYVWGIRYIDDLVCRDKASDRLYAMQDRQYKMVGIVDATGNVVERYSYTPYGETFFYAADFTSRVASAYTWVYLYTSRRLDPETGLYYFRNRYYDPGLGRFCSRDPIGYEGGAYTLSEFVGSSPVGRFDPTGLDWNLGRPIGVPHPGYGSPEPPLCTKSEFLDWYASELKKVANLIAKLEPCPCNLICYQATTHYCFGRIVRYENVRMVCNSYPGWERNVLYDWAPPWWDYHPGAKHDLRHPSGSQCTYDEEGKLLTQIPAAGTADASPIGGDHVAVDVTPFKCARTKRDRQCGLTRPGKFAKLSRTSGI